MKKIVAFVLSAVIALSTLAGCSSGGSTTGTAAPKKENVVTIARQVETATLNNFMATDGVAVIYGRMMYDSLVKGDGKGGVVPSLATSWTISEDGKKVTFKLRNDVKFHNGDQFSSADVKYTFERFIKDKTVRIGTDFIPVLVSVDTPDAQTAVFNFKQPMANLFTILQVTYVMDKKLADSMGDKMFDKPVGTGPWKFVSWTAGQQLVLQRNDDYWDWGDKKSNVDKVIFKPVGEDATRLAAIQSGDADIAEPISADQAKQLANDKNITVKDILNSAQVYFCFSAKGVFKDKNVRDAWNLAIDRETIVKTIATGAKATSWMVDSSCMGYKDVKPLFDAAKAKQLLASSSYKGEPIKILAVNGSVPRINEVLQAASSMLNAVGFNTTVSFMEQAALNAQRAAGNYDVYFVSIRQVAGDPGGLVTSRWADDMYKSGYVNTKMFELIRAQAVEMDKTKRTELLTQIFQMAYDDTAPFIPVYQMDSVSAYRNNVSGMVFTPDGMNDYSRIMKG